LTWAGRIHRVASDATGQGQQVNSMFVPLLFNSIELIQCTNIVELNRFAERLGDA
jgi:hypothetical protein